MVNPKPEHDNLLEMPGRPRPIANLGRIFGEFADLQQQLGAQMMALEESVDSQRQALVEGLPEMKQKINRLMANLFDQNCKDEWILERVGRNESEVAVLEAQVKSLTATNV